MAETTAKLVFCLLLTAPILRAEAQFQPSERLKSDRVTYQGETALLHGADGAEHSLLWLASGQIVSVPNSKTKPTKERFQGHPAELCGQLLLKKAGLVGLHAFQSNHYIIVSDTSGRFRETATRIMESMLPGIVKHVRAMKIPLHAPPTPMPVVMFRKRARFQAYRKVPDHVVAYYDPISNEVVMCEEAPESGAIGASQQLSTIAHEGAHQILHNIGVQQRLAPWPAWLNEGLAEYFAPTTFGKRMTWKGAGEVNDWRMYELERYLKSGAGPGDFINDTVVAARLTSTGYATAWALTHFLAKRRKSEFHKLMREYAQTTPLEGTTDSTKRIVLAQRVVFARHFGSDFATLEAQIVSHLRTLPYRDPFAEEPHFVGFAVLDDDGSSQKQATVFHNRRDAERWCQSHGEKAKTIVRKFESRAHAENFARRWLSNR